METSNRFNNAVTKLYNAFHKGELNSNYCSMCAVGNICDNSSSWEYAGRFYTGKTYTAGALFNVGQHTVKKTGYSTEELINVERIFIRNVGLGQFDQTKENHFKGLCAVVEYLCELEGIPNVMDYTKLFETEKDAPAYKLETVLS